MITCYAFNSVPPFAKGLVRDLRVRWALEEAGFPYRVKLVGEGEGAISRDAYRKLQPFGQIPAIEDGSLRLFESGALVLHIAERSAALLPKDPTDRAHVIQWMFTALNTVENQIQALATIDLFYPEERWGKERRPGVVEMVRARLAALAGALEGRQHLVGSFSAADVLMVSVLRILRHTKYVEEQPVRVADKDRGAARPAFAKALDGQLSALAA